MSSRPRFLGLFGDVPRTVQEARGHPRSAFSGPEFEKDTLTARERHERVIRDLEDAAYDLRQKGIMPRANSLTRRSGYSRDTVERYIRMYPRLVLTPAKPL